MFISLCTSLDSMESSLDHFHRIVIYKGTLNKIHNGIGRSNFIKAIHIILRDSCYYAIHALTSYPFINHPTLEATWSLLHPVRVSIR